MIPKQIKVGGFLYDVEVKDAPFVGENGSVVDGEHAFAGKKITVADYGCKEYRDLVFLHEVCHAIIEAYVSPEKQDERFVEGFSKGLYQVLHDNPDLIK